MKLIIVSLLLFLSSYQPNRAQEAEKPDLINQGEPLSQNSNWLNSFDFDGDSFNDQVYFEYSGGAHCCYKINILLSSNTIKVKFPFEMDGGYLFGVDNSKPEQFDIQDFDKDGLPEILMRIQTFNGEAEAIPDQWKLEYGIESNEIVIKYIDGMLNVRDFGERK